MQGIGIPDYVFSILDDFKEVTFYLRLHPRYNQDQDSINLIKNKYQNQIEIERANSVSLYELFSEVDYHLTCYSGSAIEAEYFNVPNIIFGQKGYLTYKNEIDSKKYFY